MKKNNAYIDDFLEFEDLADLKPKRFIQCEIALENKTIDAKFHSIINDSNKTTVRLICKTKDALLLMVHDIQHVIVNKTGPNAFFVEKQDGDSHIASIESLTDGYVCLNTCIITIDFIIS